MYASTLPRSNWLRRASIRLAWYRHMPASSYILFSYYFISIFVCTSCTISILIMCYSRGIKSVDYSTGMPVTLRWQLYTVHSCVSAVHACWDCTVDNCQRSVTDIYCGRYRRFCRLWRGLITSLRLLSALWGGLRDLRPVPENVANELTDLYIKPLLSNFNVTKKTNK